MLYKILGFLKFVVVCLVSSVVVYFAYLVYADLTHSGGDIFRGSRYTLDTFLDNLHDEKIPSHKEHQHLYKALTTLNKERLGNINKNSDVPYDYRFFFQEVLPAFLDSPEQTLTNTGGQGPILATFARDADYVAKMLLISGPESKILSGKRRIKGYEKRLEMTGTYTSAFHYPTGLFVVDGDVINPVLQKWDGLVILDASGTLHIKDIHTLEYRFRHFKIKQSYQDYLDFLKLAEEQKFSIFQTHLLIKNGEIDVSPISKKRFRRRVIFQDRHDAISIYDSFDKQLTFYELAQTLKEQYDAFNVVNLDMGPYGYCARYERDKRVILYNGKGKGVQLSNIIIFNYN